MTRYVLRNHNMNINSEIVEDINKFSITSIPTQQNLYIRTINSTTIVSHYSYPLGKIKTPITHEETINVKGLYHRRLKDKDILIQYWTGT